MFHVVLCEVHREAKFDFLTINDKQLMPRGLTLRMLNCMLVALILFVLHAFKFSKKCENTHAKRIAALFIS
jgi:hypothetical protein